MPEALGLTPMAYSVTLQAHYREKIFCADNHVSQQFYYLCDPED